LFKKEALFCAQLARHLKAQITPKGE
jgi:hypothetical protein